MRGCHDTEHARRYTNGSPGTSACGRADKSDGGSAVLRVRLVQASGTKSAPVWLLGTICPKTALKHITSHSGSTTRGDRNGVNGALCKEGISRSKDGTPGGVWAGRSAFAMAMGCCWYCSHHPPISFANFHSRLDFRSPCTRAPVPRTPCSRGTSSAASCFGACKWSSLVHAPGRVSCPPIARKFVGTKYTRLSRLFYFAEARRLTAGKALPRPGSPFQSRRTFLWWFLTQF